MTFSLDECDVPVPEENAARVRARVGADAQSAGVVAWWRDRPRRDRALSALRAAREELDAESARLRAERAVRTERYSRDRAAR